MLYFFIISGTVILTFLTGTAGAAREQGCYGSGTIITNTICVNGRVSLYISSHIDRIGSDHCNHGGDVFTDEGPGIL